MKFFWIWNGKKMKQVSIIIIAAFFTAGVLFVERNELMVFTTPEGPQAFYKGNGEDNKVSLTFNISWGEERAVPILDILQEKEITATFFVSAAWAERYPELIERIIDDGHEVGNHGYRYENYTSWDDDKIKKDIRNSDQILQELTSEKLSLLRPPNGQFDKRVLSIADSLDYSVVHWSVNGKDYENPGVDVIVDNIVSSTNSGDVLLLHASDSAKQTHEALPIIIEKLTNDGFSFVTVSELMSGADTETEQIN
ncbi:polysaccharide deacetylase family sporulation protein PdaB [Alkalihalobacillus sp. LMS39]|uniref:polysaccharide deacetylase family sporulation protein PdaB n=1 Tax=Alkalihalobacillus sp. LMS39 TaxID=2924032 RepID=UPI001FB1D433|nr:polysaccharide deacetylase family sporulation protein PdaB [Alkalihalobacillus sp. LMS39]UOE94294.1 polysaccharide deacetylase family sporulation protein PdaB [Alkalihalobacillus sp. LMS39]